MTEKLLTDLNLPDLLKEFKQNFYESFWKELEQRMKLMKQFYKLEAKKVSTKMGRTTFNRDLTDLNFFLNN